ncbi:restriction endonuclease subunit S [Pseudomonas asiatica]|uniref:restriction endonuclease subunit S n=1 Tax=Pseudomonas asiatica TaxID=2219225 RepID=UPI00236566B0|nr:restriction endonuclease subunit S [Pseudomonas asiatica]MDD1980443.1 restriction endonuclease subunit S [Pseudomonas asiatica]
MSSKWPLKELELIANEVTVGYVGPMASEYVEDGVPFLRSLNIQPFRINTNEIKYVTPEFHKQIKKSALRPGDVAIVRTGKPGTCAVIPDWLPDANCSDLVIVRCGEQIRPRFLCYWVNSVAAHHISSHTVGAVQQHFNVGAAKKMKVAVPDIATQDAVVEVLGSIDDRITLLRETNATLEAIAQALFKSWFVDFDPVRAKAEGRQPEDMDAATAALFPDSFEDSELGLVPKGSRIERAEQWLSVLETGRRPKGGVSGILDGVPSIGAESIVRIGEFDYSKTKYVSAEFFEKMKSGALQSHDVLLYKDGGKPGVFLPRVSMFGDGFPFEVCGINEHVFRVRLKEPFSQAFLYYWLWSDAVMHELKHRGGKAAIPGINQSDVKELKLLVPSEQALARFDEITMPLISRIFANSKQAQTLTQLRDILLPRLISGQLRLPDAEHAVEAALA